MTESSRPGNVLLMSSGETASSGHEMYQRVFDTLVPPVRVALLETPAGFELNSPLVAGRVRDFLEVSMKNFSPAISVIPARRRDGPFSTNDPSLLAPILEANFLYLGAGSPTYLVRHLSDSLALEYLLGRHRNGAILCLTSAAAIAFSSKALPVYEIYKAGHDLHWVDGLDLFGPFGLDLAIVTHWDNQEGGPQLDTRHCFMGRPRMELLRKLLPPVTLVLGIDEHTGVIFDFQSELCHVLGKGGVTLLGQGAAQTFGTGEAFPMRRLGPYHIPPQVPTYGSPLEPRGEGEEAEIALSPEVLDLLQKREAARQAHDWAEADAIRQQIAALGLEVRDAREGPRLRYKRSSTP